MQKTQKKTVVKPLALKEWVYPAKGKTINELLKTSFLEFYLTRDNTNFTKKRQKAGI